MKSLDKLNTTLDFYRKFVELKFKSEAACYLREYLNRLKVKLSGDVEVNTRFMKMFEAFAVFFAKIVSLKNNRNTVEREDIYNALYFIEFYSAERLWPELSEGRTFRTIKNLQWNFLDELRKCCNIEVSFNAKKGFEEIVNRFTIYATQIFNENEYSIREKFILLIRYTFIILSLLLSSSKGEQKLSLDTVLKSYELFRIVFFRLPDFEFNVLFNVKHFIRKEIIMRLLEYMEKSDQNHVTNNLVERVVEDIGCHFIINDNPLLYSEVKSLIQIICLFIYYSRDSINVNENDNRTVLNIYNSIHHTIFEGNHYYSYRSFYDELSHQDLSIDARIFLNNIGNMIIGFDKELNLPDSILNLLPEFARKLTHSLSLISKIFAFKRKKTESNVEDVKKSINIISNIFFNIKRRLPSYY